MQDSPDSDKKSKSQIKREMEELRRLGERLLHLPDVQLESLDDPALIGAIRECKRIRKGSARKRQVQYIGKLMRSANVEQVRQLIDRFDAGSRSHTMQFHKLERWRRELMDGNKEVMAEVINDCPDVDRQHLNQLIRNAVNERNMEEDPPVHFRRLFRYLKSISDAVDI